MLTAESPEIIADAGFTFPEPLVPQNSPTARHYDALLRGLTHKMNNLLAVIQGFSSLVLMQDGLDEMSTENLQHMKDAATSASDLGERIMPAGGCSRVDLADVALVDALPMLVTRLRTQVEKAEIPFQTNLSQNLPVVRADQDRLRTILDELVKNAVEAAGPRGEVGLDVLAPGTVPGSSQHAVDFFVRNTGEDIPDEMLLEVFKPFHTTKDNSHLGIGLTTAYVLAGRMDMSIGVKSGGGMTTFWLAVPVA